MPSPASERRAASWPAVSAAPQRIPDGARLISLNWCRSSSNEYECFAFDLNRDGSSCRLSGRFVDPEGGGRTEAEEVPLDDGRLKSIEGCLKSGGFRVCGEREPEEGVYDGVSDTVAGVKKSFSGC